MRILFPIWRDAGMGGYGGAVFACLSEQVVYLSGAMAMLTASTCNG